MTNKDLYRCFGDLDPELITRAAPTEKAQKKKAGAQMKRSRIRLGALAACFCLILGMRILIPMLRDTGNRPSLDAPTISTITSGNKIIGKQELVYGELPSENKGAASTISPGFHIRTVVQANVIEVLPDDFYLPGSSYRYLVARLSVVEEIRGEGLPDEIFLKFPFYEADIFDGYDTFILSLQQIGVENYMMINKTKQEVTYFSHMFTVASVSDLGYGSVIAFTDDKIDTGFFKKADHFHVHGFIEKLLDDPSLYSYPAGHDTSLSEVKANIVKLSQKDSGEGMFISSLPCDYITAEDIFLSDESRQIKDYLKPSESNVFLQEIDTREDRVIVTYTRVINGFLTEEKIMVNDSASDNGHVTRSDVIYTEEDLAKVPHIGEALENIKLSELIPPHIEIVDGMSLKYANATGVYRKVDGKIYGIIRVMWFYTDPAITNGFIRDDCYYLYDKNGNGALLERDELQAVIGDDTILLWFSYRYTYLFGK